MIPTWKDITLVTLIWVVALGVHYLNLTHGVVQDKGDMSPLGCALFTTFMYGMFRVFYTMMEE